MRDVGPVGLRHLLRCLYEAVDAADRPRSYELLHIRMVTEESIDRQVQQVVREVFRSSPGDVAVVVHCEPNAWEQEWEEDVGWQWSTG